MELTAYLRVLVTGVATVSFTVTLPTRWDAPVVRLAFVFGVDAHSRICVGIMQNRLVTLGELATNTSNTRAFDAN